MHLPSAMNDTLLTICRTDEVPVGGVIKVETNGLVVAVFNLDGRFFVTDDQCTHGPGSLSEGCVDGDEIECAFHNGRFHIPSGAVAGPPCIIPLPIYAVKVIEDQVCIDPTPRIVA
jgi:nitrite reductase/ring-hydroxylating ferredoxin subunit